jgi:TPR repeat protein
MGFLKLLSLITSARNAKASMATARHSMGLLRTKVEDLRTLSFQRTREKAAAGDAEAQYDLGAYYYDGRGVSRDFEEAYRWFLAAAEHGHPKAQANAGLMNYLGRGVPRDEAEACKWLALAAEAGDEGARVSLESARKKVSAGQVAAGIKRAREFRRRTTA